MKEREMIVNGDVILGIELGSTRIKAVLTDLQGTTLATAGHSWENSLIDGIWTYSLAEIHDGLQAVYLNLRQNIRTLFGVELTAFKALGISAMMHGYMAFDAEDKLLAPFQTWRNSNTEQAADELTELFNYNIPLRWTIAHIYQRILDGETHVADLAYVTTLSGYIHYLLTGKKVLGIGDASGIFPIDYAKADYDRMMLDKFDELIKDKGYKWQIREILPEVLVAGTPAGNLTAAGAKFLDPSGKLMPGAALCPPEGDAGTGMVATNAVAPTTANVSVGTSSFAMLVLKALPKKLYREIDIVATPAGDICAMSHANNGTSDLNAWVQIFKEYQNLFGMETATDEIYRKLYTNSLHGDADGGGLLAYGFYSGESIMQVNEGRPALLRTPNSKFTLANLFRTHLYSALATIKVGLELLQEEQNLKITKVVGHGGFFQTPVVGQTYLSAVFDAPVTVMANAGEGGAFGIALLANYMLNKEQGETLANYLERKIFLNIEQTTLKAEPTTIAGFAEFVRRYKEAIAVEKEAVRTMNW